MAEPVALGREMEEAAPVQQEMAGETQQQTAVAEAAPAQQGMRSSSMEHHELKLGFCVSAEEAVLQLGGRSYARSGLVGKRASRCGGKFDFEGITFAAEGTGSTAQCCGCDNAIVEAAKAGRTVGKLVPPGSSDNSCCCPSEIVLLKVMDASGGTAFTLRRRADCADCCGDVSRFLVTYLYSAMCAGNKSRESDNSCCLCLACCCWCLSGPSCQQEEQQLLPTAWRAENGGDATLSGSYAYHTLYGKSAMKKVQVDFPEGLSEQAAEAFTAVLFWEMQNSFPEGGLLSLQTLQTSKR